MAKSIPKVHEYTDAWRWPADVERFIRTELPPDARVLNCPAGNSSLGDVLVDAEPQNENIRKGDMFGLTDQFPAASFDAVVSDPPWKGVNYFDRWKAFFECVALTKPNGIIIYNATWEPYSDQCEVIGRYRRADGAFRLISQITVYRRYPNQTTLKQYIDDIAAEPTLAET